MSPFLGTRGAGSNRAFGYAGAAAPAQVTGLTATNLGSGRAFNNGRIDLSWSTPASNGATITGYRIQRSTDGSTYSTLVANTGTTATTYSDTGLSSNQIYYYRIAAINAAGTGLNSTAANATATTVPQAPTVSAANVGTGRAYNNGAATITVSGGATGGSAITSYTATSSPGSFTATSGSPLTVTGLQSATAYTFSVTATNANGTSTATVSNSITATTVPQAPTIGTATAGNAQATITFTANATGGSAITTFTSTSSPAAGSGSSASSPITHTGLSNGTAYTFTVTATNANGTSAASAASNSVTPAVPGSYETIASASGGSGTITFSSIPSTYKNLQIRIMARNTNNSTTQEFGNIDIRFNSDSAANYSDHTLSGNGASAISYGNFTNRTLIGVTTNPCGDVTANCFGVAIIDIPDYASTGKFKTTRALTGGDFNGSGSVNLQSGNWRSTSAINRIDLISYGGTTYNSNTSIALYGIKG